MKHLAMAGVIAVLLGTGITAQAAGLSGDALRVAQAAESGGLKKKLVKEECENGCNNHPEVPKTRALKPKPQKEACDENGCNNRPEAPKTRGLRKKEKKEECDGSCN